MRSSTGDTCYRHVIAAGLKRDTIVLIGHSRIGNGHISTGHHGGLTVNFGRYEPMNINHLRSTDIESIRIFRYSKPRIRRRSECEASIQHILATSCDRVEDVGRILEFEIRHSNRR